MSTAKTDSTSVEIPKSDEAASDLAWLLIKAVFFTMAIVVFLIVITILAAGWWVHTQIKTFENNAGVTRTQLLSTVRDNWGIAPVQTNNHILFLILGLDTVKNKPNQQPLSDTLLLANVNLATSQISLLPLPRDTWSAEYQTKVNALYYYGLEKYPTQPEQFPKEVISQLVGLPIEHTIVVSLEDLVALVDLVGGIQVDVPEAFTDSQFPREDVDLTTAKPSDLYETISFPAGSQHMDGTTASKYIRSRKSAGESGNDVSRGNRQEQILNALLTKILSTEVITNPVLLGKLYAFYEAKFAKSVPFSELVKIMSTLSNNSQTPTLTTGTLSTSLTDSKNPVLTHPNPALYGNQWVFIPTTPEILLQAVHQQLGRTP
jgi:LCP family protein required for cell wall assembly